MPETSSKISSVFLIIAFELLTVNSSYYDENTRHRRSTCQLRMIQSSFLFANITILEKQNYKTDF